MPIRNNFFAIVFFVLFQFSSDGSLCAQTVPSILTYQGRLALTNGATVPDGNYNLTFSIFPQATGGTANWTETEPSVPVQGGLFTVLLGSSIALTSAALAGTPYVEISINGGAPLVPRQQLSSVPFALQSASVPSGAISTAQIAPGAVTADKIASVNYASITNPPPTVAWFNVTNYGAKGDGINDDGPAIRAALAAILARGGGTLYFPAGTYRGSVAPHPFNASYMAIGDIPGNTRVVGDGKGATVIGFLPNQPDYARIFLNYQIASGGDENITVEDLTLDGFATDQVGTNAQYGLFIMRARNLKVRNVQFRNIFGSASSGNGEGFFSEFQLGTGAYYTDCECVGGSGSSSSGFSADGATDVNYAQCASYGLTVSQAFTHNGCRHVTYTGCHAYLCPGGFNSEVSYNVTYDACTAGGYSTTTATYPYTNNTPLSLGTTYGGFLINGSQMVQLINCTSTGNTNGSGVWIQNGNSVLVNGGMLASNKNFGVVIDSASIGTTRIMGRPNLTGNAHALSLPNSLISPIEGVLPTPGMPGSGTSLTNPYPIEVTVYVSGGTVSAIAVSGRTSGLTSGTFRVPAGATIAITYTSAPTWNWIAG